MTYEITIDEETCAAIESQYVEGRSVSQIARMKLFQDIVRGVLVHRGVAMRSVGHNLRGRAPRVLQGAELVMAKTMREAGESWHTIGEALKTTAATAELAYWRGVAK